jgi:hydrogenase maturation protease
MKALVAGIGNIFCGDDGFGVEVVRRLAERKLPGGVVVRDFGIRGFDLSCSMTESWDLIILVDTISRGGQPGSIYLVELDPANQDQQFANADPHALHPANAIELAKALGEINARLLLVGCQPANLEQEDDCFGLSEPVESAVEQALECILGIFDECERNPRCFESQSGVQA